MSSTTSFPHYRLARPATQAEWATYHRIRREVLLESLKYEFEHPNDEHEPQHFPLLLWHEDEAIGTIRIDIIDPTMAALRLVAIDPKYQGRGHGSALLGQADAFARGLGCAKAVVFATMEAVGFYERCGFVEDEWNDCEIGGIVQMVKPLA